MEGKSMDIKSTGEKFRMTSKQLENQVREKNKKMKIIIAIMLMFFMLLVYYFIF